MIKWPISLLTSAILTAYQFGGVGVQEARADASVVAQDAFATDADIAAAAFRANPTWLQALSPFKIADNLYYVGTRGLASYLFVTPNGHILLDATLEQTEPMIEANIRAMGFRLRDVRYLLSSHAHWDHVAGLARMKESTGGLVVATAADAASIEAGRNLEGTTRGTGWKAVRVERVIADGERVVLGQLSLTAHVTPGHTRGCTSWETNVLDNGQGRRAVFVCSLSIGANIRLLGNTLYPEIAEDYAKSVRVLRGLSAQLWFAPHGEQFGLQGKLARVTFGTGNPFVDTEGYRAYVDGAEKNLADLLARERDAR